MARAVTIDESLRKELTMFAVLSTFSLLAFVVGAGFVTPILLSLLERARGFGPWASRLWTIERAGAGSGDRA